MRIVRAIVPLVSLPVLGLALVGPAAADAAAQPLCMGAASMSTTSVRVAATSSTPTIVRDVRVGHHAGCDRMVFEFTGQTPGYAVRYVPSVTHDGSGQPVILAGSAFLNIDLRPTSTETHAPQSRMSPGYAVLREVAGAGDFEGVTTYGVGLGSKQPFVAYRLTNPNRLVIDVASPVSTASARTTPAQVTQVPSGGVSTGGGSTAGRQYVGLLAAGGGLLLAAGAMLGSRRRVLARG